MTAPRLEAGEAETLAIYPSAPGRRFTTRTIIKFRTDDDAGCSVGIDERSARSPAHALRMAFLAMLAEGVLRISVLKTASGSGAMTSLCPMRRTRIARSTLRQVPIRDHRAVDTTQISPLMRRNLRAWSQAMPRTAPLTSPQAALGRDGGNIPVIKMNDMVADDP